jgi:hypothetical protein
MFIYFKIYICFCFLYFLNCFFLKYCNKKPFNNDPNFSKLNIFIDDQMLNFQLMIGCKYV